MGRRERRPRSRLRRAVAQLARRRRGDGRSDRQPHRRNQAQSRFAPPHRLGLERRRSAEDGAPSLPPPHAVLRGGRTSFLPALSAKLRHFPRRSLQHRLLFAAHAHGRAAVRPGAWRLRLDGRGLPHLQEPLRAGRAAALEPRPYPKLVIHRRPESIFDYRYEDFEIVGYDPHPHIKGVVSV